MSSIKILNKGITDIEADALVNPANNQLLHGGGVCGVLFRAAGASQLQAACNQYGYCKTGEAVITSGFKLCKYIIHAVGPEYSNSPSDPKLLYSAYKQSLILAKNNNIHSIVFPLISAGIFGYPIPKAFHKAIQACNDFINNNPDYDIDIYFAIPDINIYNIGINTLKTL